MFKKGDKVRRIQDDHEGMVVGDVAVVRFDQLPDNPNLELVGYDWVHDSRKFELAGTTKETISSWLKENAWYIRVESPEHSKLIQEWLFEHDYRWQFPDYADYVEPKVLTNTQCGGCIKEFIMHTTEQGWCVTHAQELKPQFKLTLEDIILPEAPKKTEQQLKLEELEATIQKAQQEIQKASAEVQALKEMK